MLTSLAVRFADTRADALSWWLGDAPPALDELVLHSSSGQLTLRLLGASHQAVARVLDAEVPEVVACGRTPADLPAAVHHDLPGGRYRFTSTTTTYDDRGLARVADRLRRRWEPDPAAVVGMFPGSEHALTVLAGRELRRGWGWRTWHVYPGGGEVVRTTSSLVTA
ncbi:MAG: DUF2617 family protein [Mycobacteriales bacterium]